MTGTDAPRRYVFLLIDGYSHLGFTCALEALSLANRFPGPRRYYDWLILSETGQPVAAWNGVTVQVDGALQDLRRDDTLIVCAGERAATGATRNVVAWLRREARRGMDFGALSAGTYVLARAGLIAGKRVTTHWEYVDALTEALPDAVMDQSIYVVDGKVFTCAGGASSMDLMLDRINRDYGPELATWVADQMVYPVPRSEGSGQRMTPQSRSGLRHNKLTVAVEIMQANLEETLPPSEIAEVVGLSTRQMERLFARYLGTSPKKYYLSLRLEKARHLLMHSELTLTEVCVLCGFISPSHFSKAYRKAFGVAPSRDTGGSKLLWPRRPA